MGISRRMREGADQWRSRLVEEQIRGGADQWRSRSVEEPISGGADQWRSRSMEEQISRGADQWRNRSVEERVSREADQWLIVMYNIQTLEHIYCQAQTQHQYNSVPVTHTYFTILVFLSLWYVALAPTVKGTPTAQKCQKTRTRATLLTRTYINAYICKHAHVCARNRM